MSLVLSLHLTHESPTVVAMSLFPPQMPRWPSSHWHERARLVPGSSPSCQRSASDPGNSSRAVAVTDKYCISEKRDLLCWKIILFMCVCVCVMVSLRFHAHCLSGEMCSLGRFVTCTGCVEFCLVINNKEAF